MIFVMVRGFSWVVDRTLAGMAWPGESDELSRNAVWLSTQGVRQVITLTRRAIDPVPMTAAHIQTHHLAVADFAGPSMDQLTRFVELVSAMTTAGGATAVHCAIGMGRTGTCLAAFLVAAGSEPHDAIARIRELRPGSIESPAQQHTVFEFAELKR